MNGTRLIPAIARRAAQLAFMGASVAALAVLPGWPPYRTLPEDAAEIKVSLRHAGQLVGECRELPPEELARLPANMRAPLQCPRERSPLVVQVDVNGRRAIDATVEPQGLHADGRATLYRRLQVPAGPIEVEIRMKDDIRLSEFGYHGRFDGVLEPGRALIVDFDDQSDAFVFR
ncbi:MAG TPA: hypothetical protein VF210_16060 [Pseudomonadales bacterium]